jgi:hypothetical protein
MSYNLRDVQYISQIHTLPNTTYASGGLYGAMAIDISSMVNTQALGGKPVGLAVYRAHIDLASDASGAPIQVGETATLRVMVTAKDIGTTGDNITGTGLNSLNCNSALNIAGLDYYGPGAGVGGNSGTGGTFLEPSDEVPYVVVRDTIYIIWQNGNGAMTADMFLSVRLEVAPIKVTTNLMNQLIRTQSQ